MNTETKLASEATTYIRKCLANGKTLSSLLLQLKDIDSGSVTTFLPIGMSREEAKEFTIGGKVAAPSSDFSEEVIGSNGSKWLMVPTPNTNVELTTIIQSFLRAEQEHICIFEDAVAAPTDAWLSSSGTRVLTFNDEVYHCLTKDDAVATDKILNTINRAGSWLFIAAMTSAPNRRVSSLDAGTITSDELRVMAERTKAVVVGAYDGEGYLIWNQSGQQT